MLFPVHTHTKMSAEKRAVRTRITVKFKQTTCKHDYMEIIGAIVV